MAENNLTTAQVTQLNRNFRQSPNWPRNVNMGTIIQELMAGTDDATHEPVALIADLQALPEDELSDRMMILCEETGAGLYRYDSSSSAIASVGAPYDVVKPTAVTTGRFLRIMGLTATAAAVGLARDDDDKRVIADASDDVETAIADLDNSQGAGLFMGASAVSSTAASTDISAVADASGFSLSVDGDVAEDVLINPTADILNTPALIVGALNTAMAALEGANNSQARIYWTGDALGTYGRYILSTPDGVDTIVFGAGAAVVDLSANGQLELDSTDAICETNGAILYDEEGSVLERLADFMDPPERQQDTAAVVAFAGGATVVITLPIPLVAASTYSVMITPGENLVCWATAKSVTQFTINCSAPPTVDVDWAIRVQ